MAHSFAALESHLQSLHITGGAPVPEPVWQSIEATAGGTFPDVVRWLFAHHAGASFADGAQFPGPDGAPTVFGWFLGADELASAFADSRNALPDAVVPLANDGGDNYVCVDLATGAACAWRHDAPTDRALMPLAPSIEAFLRSLT